MHRNKTFLHFIAGKPKVLKRSQNTLQAWDEISSYSKILLTVNDWVQISIFKAIIYQIKYFSTVASTTNNTTVAAAYCNHG